MFLDHHTYTHVQRVENTRKSVLLYSSSGKDIKENGHAFASGTIEIINTSNYDPREVQEWWEHFKEYIKDNLLCDDSVFIGEEITKHSDDDGLGFYFESVGVIRIEIGDLTNWSAEKFQKHIEDLVKYLKAELCKMQYRVVV